MTSSEKDIEAAVGHQLRLQHADWDVIPEQANFSRERIIDRAEKICAAVASVSGSADYLGVDQAFDQTRNFVDNTFDIYEGKKESEQHAQVFLVHGRGENGQRNKYASEVTQFLPILDPAYGVDDVTRQYTTSILAPSVIETYIGRDKEEGAVIWTPLHIDSSARADADLWRHFISENIAGIRRSISETADFAARRLGARVMGLGASIPSFTQLGKTIKQEGVVTTTGHAGTVYLLHETVREVVETRGLNEKTIGLLGAGSIGSSWAGLLLDEKDGYRVSVYDRDDTQLGRLRQKINEEQIDVLDDEFKVLESSNIIVSAINRTLDLDEMEHRIGKRVNLEGKVIIDDSQPGSFDREQVEARGGSLVWVVGQDTSKSQALHRKGGYNFGETAGLYGKGAVWGCEAEAASIYLEDRQELAVRSHVTPEMAIAIGGLCRSIGVGVASPLQSFGSPVKLN